MINKKLFMIFITCCSFYILLFSHDATVLKQELEQEVVPKESGILEELQILKEQNISKEIRNFILEDKHLEAITDFGARVSGRDFKEIRKELLDGYDKNFDSFLYLYEYLKNSGLKKDEKIDFEKLKKELGYNVLNSNSKNNYLDYVAIKIVIDVLKKYLENEKNLSFQDIFDAIKKDYFRD